MYRPPMCLSSILIIAVLWLGGCGGTATPATPRQTTEQGSSITIPRGLDAFTPYILPVQPSTTVTWQNTDTVTHTITTVPEHLLFLNPESFSLTVAPGQAVTYTPTHPGVYYYYDQTQGSWSDYYHRVMPNKGVPKYPMAMEGIIWVQGAIAGLPTHAANSIVNLHDQIDQFVVAVKTGGTVSWQNHDTDPHFFMTVLGWDPPINPVEVGIDNLLGEDAVPPDGETKSITFTTPGLYYYYCFTHATVDPVLLRVTARSMASEYPVPMDGFVLVTNS